jgi:undecaprenyl-diphosphatase
MLVLVTATVAGVLALRYEGTSHPGRVDQRVADVLAGWPPVLRVVVDLGDPGPLAVLILLVAAGAASMRRGVLFALVAPPLAVLATSVVLKPLVGRMLGEGLAYPSTHMTGVGAVLVVIWILVVCRQDWAPAVRGAVAVVLLAVGAVQAGTLSALSLHYATDTVGGACVAVAVVVLCALVHDAASAAIASAWGDRSEKPRGTLVRRRSVRRS